MIFLSRIAESVATEGVLGLIKFIPLLLLQRLKPIYAQQIVFCRRIEESTDTDLIDLIGVFDKFTAPSFPCTSQFMQFSRIIFRKRGTTEYHCRFRILAPDGSELASGAWQALKYAALDDAARLSHGIEGLIFETPGLYHVLLEMKSGKHVKLICKAPLKVVYKKPSVSELKQEHTGGDGVFKSE